MHYASIAVDLHSIWFIDNTFIPFLIQYFIMYQFNLIPS